MKIERTKRRRAGELALEMTPMIDVVFLLLIFFLLATTFDDRAGLKIELPKSTIREQKIVQKLQLFVQKDKKMFFSYEEGGKIVKISITKEELKTKLKEQLQNAETKSIVISADQSLSHGYIVELMSLAKESGAEALNIDTNYKK